MESIKIYIEHNDGSETKLEIPLGISMSLMEVLKGEGYPIDAVCGGMALCATCRIIILNSDELSLEDPNYSELDILDSLPDTEEDCRLACQIPISEALDNLRIRLHSEILVH